MLNILKRLMIIIGVWASVGVSYATSLNDMLEFQTYFSGDFSDRDFLEIKTVIDGMLPPSAISAKLERTVDDFVSTITQMLPDTASQSQRITAIRQFLYEPGPWNDHRPFSYDMDDPLGTDINNKLLSTYLETRKGNCVSMPLLFLILADRLGVAATIATAPNHVFIMVKDELTGEYINLETTSGGYPARTSHIREAFPMTDRALSSGIYMRPLNRQEVAAMMATTLLEYHYQREEYAEVQAVAEAILKLNPKNIEAIVYSGSAYGRQIEKFQKTHPNPALLSQDKTMQYNLMVRKNAEAFEYAEHLGWRPQGH